MDRRDEMYAGLAARPQGFNGESDWSAFGCERGYTGKGDLAGWYGGRNPSMLRLPDGRRVLTEAGRERARRRGY